MSTGHYFNIRAFFLNVLFTIIISLSAFTIGWGQSSNFVLAEGFVEGAVNESIHYSQSGIHLVTNSQIKGKFSFESDVFVSDQGFAQALVGPNYTVTDHLRLSALIGLVNNPSNPLRLGTTFSYQTKIWEGLMTYQWGPASNYFYVFEWARKIKKIVIGIRGQRYLNTGLFLGGHPWKHTRVWTQTGYEFELKRYSLALGISILFI